MGHPVPRKNPYIIGRPIDEPTLFFGRQNLFSFLDANLRQNVKISLLHGQRRIGKSSIVRIIPKIINSDDFVFIRFDLEYYSGENIGEILLGLAKEILDQLELDQVKINLPNLQDLKQDINVFDSEFLFKVFEEIKNKKIVLLFDEFDSLITYSQKSDIEKFLNYLQSIVKVDNRLFLILCADRQTEDRPNLFHVFPDISSYEIGFLNEENTEKLIKEPAKDILEYEPEAINKIFELSAGHPYFIQTICFAIFVRARELEKWQVTLQDVDKIIDKAIEYAEAGLAWFWDGLTITEKIVFSVVAEFQYLAIEKKQMLPKTPFKLLEKMYKVAITPSIEKASLQLVKSNFLNQSGNKIIIELVRLWLLKRHPLSQEIKNFKKNNSEKKNTFNDKYINNDQSENKEINNSYVYDAALALPSFLFTDPFRHSFQRKKPEIKLSNNQKLWEEKSQYSNRNVEEYIIPGEQIIRKNIFSKKSYLTLITYVVLIAAPILAIVSVSRFPQFLSLNEKRCVDISCGKNPSANISNGDRALFLIKGNSNRDEGIKAFKEDNYQDAIEPFKKAIAADPNDPEVLIYYNNALAREQGNPLTLAVVVPVDNGSKANIAPEILRGVAQAQNELNQQGGLNNRLLEIVIANDAGEPQSAKKIAAELTKKNSILGVIGHFSRETTESALKEYQKAEIPVIAPISSGLSLQNDILFRSLPSDTAASKQLAEYAFKNLNIKNIVIFSNPQSSYSESIRKEFTKIFEEIGGKVVYKPQIDFTNPSFEAKDEVEKSVFQYKAQAAFLIMDAKDTDVALKIAQANDELRKNNPNQGLKLLGNDTLYSERILSASRENLEGLIIPVPWFRESRKANQFAERAAKQWKGDVSWRTAISFDATQAFIQALSQSENPTRLEVRKNLQNINLSPNKTSGNKLQFNSERERIIEPVLVRVENGKFMIVEPTTPPH